MSKNRASDYTKPQYSVSRALADTGVFDSSLSQSLYSTTVDRYLSKTELARAVGKIGRVSTELPCDASYIQESDPYNQANQVQVVAQVPVGVEDHIMTFKDYMQRLELLGVDIRKFQQWGKLEAFNYVPPINLDKFANFADYYWCPPTPILAPDYITIANPTRQVEDRRVYQLSRNADFVGVSPPARPVEGTVWFDTVNIQLKQYQTGIWTPIDTVRFSITMVNIISRALIVRGDLTRRVQSGELVMIEPTTQEPGILLRVTSIDYDGTSGLTTVQIEYDGDIGVFRDRYLYVDPLAHVTLAERANFTEPTQSSFRVRPSVPFTYGHLPDIIWGKYIRLVGSSTGATSLGSITFLDVDESADRFVDLGVRTGDFILVHEQPNRGLYQIDTITGDRVVTLNMPSERGQFFEQTQIDYSVLRSRALIDIISVTPPLAPLRGEYWVDIETDTLRQYLPPSTPDPDECLTLDMVWVPVIRGITLLINALESRYISNFYPEDNQWSSSNYWRHRSVVNTLGIANAKQAQLPILEFNDGLELASWRRINHKWSYRASVDDAFRPTTMKPNLLELQSFDVYQPESMTRLSIGSAYGDRTMELTPGTRFRIVDSLGGQLDGVYEVEQSLFVRYATDEFRTVVTLKSNTPLRAVFSLPGGRIVPVQTSVGDGWNGYSTHWRYEGIAAVNMTAPRTRSSRHNASNNVIRTFTNSVIATKVALTYQEVAARVNTVITSIDIAPELLEAGVYHPTTNSTLVYINGHRVTNYRDAPSTVSGGYVGQIVFNTPQTLSAGDVIRIELGPVVSSDIGRTSVPVFNGTDTVFMNLSEFTVVPQIKVELNQSPLFTVYTAEQEPVDRASTLFEYEIDDDNGEFNFWIQRSIARTVDGEYQFRLTLQEEGNRELFAYKDRASRYTEQNISELRSVWYSNPESPVFITPKFVDRCGRPACILTDTGDLNPDGFWQVPEFWTTNVINDTRTTLPLSSLTTHFRSIIDAQTSAATPEGRALFFVNNSPNLALGGTIKLFNYGPGMSISSLMVSQTDPIGVIQHAHDAYLALTETVVDHARQVLIDSIGTSTTTSRTSFIDGVVERAIKRFEDNDELNRVYGDSTNSSKLRNFVDTLPTFGQVRYQHPQIIDVLGEQRLVHHDGHVTTLTFNIAQIRAMLVNLIRTEIKSAHKYLSATGSFNPATIPRRGDGALVAFFVQPQYMTTVSGTTPPVLAEPTISVKRETVSSTGITTFEPYTPTTFTIINPEQVASPDHVLVYDPSVGVWQRQSLVDLVIEIETSTRLAIEQRLYEVQSTTGRQYNTAVTIPDTNWTTLQELRFEEWVSTNRIDRPYESTYRADDPFTWNYTGAVIRTHPQLVTSIVYAHWEAIYELLYGTPYPHIEPWKLQGYHTKPVWWDEEYASTTMTRKWTTQMWFNIVYGIIPVGRTSPNGATVSTVDRQQLVAGYRYVPVNTTDTNMVVADPLVSATPQVYAPDAILPPYVDVTQLNNLPSWVRSVFNKDPNTGLPETAFPNREAPTTFGVRGPVECMWRRSSQYLYDQLITAWQIDPIRFTYMMFGFRVGTIGRAHFERDSRALHSYTNTTFHGDYVGETTNIVSQAGLGQWYINLIRALRHDATEGSFRHAWVNWRPHLAYMFNRIVDENSVHLTSPTAEIVQGDYSLRVKQTRELDRVNHSALNVKVLSVPSKYSPQRAQGKGWEFEVSSASPFDRSLTFVETDTYFVSPSINDDPTKWYINRFAITGVERYTSRSYQTINYLGGWVDYTYLTMLSEGTHEFGVQHETPLGTELITITVVGSEQTRTIGGLLGVMSQQLVDANGTQVGTFALRNGNLVLYSYNRNRVGRLTIQPTTFFELLAPTNPISGSVIGSYAGVQLLVNGDSNDQTVVSIAGNRTLVIEPGDNIVLTGTRGDGSYRVDEVRYDFTTGTTELVFYAEMPFALIAEGYAVKSTSMVDWSIGDEVHVTSDDVLPSPLSEQLSYFVADVHHYDNTTSVEYIRLSPSQSNANHVAAAVSRGDSLDTMNASYVVRALNMGSGNTRVGKLASTFQALQGVVVDTFWKRYKLATTIRTVIGPVSITSVQALIDFVHGYEQHGIMQGFVFDYEGDVLTDERTGRARGWQLELERTISTMFNHTYEGVESHNAYSVSFIDASTLVFDNGAPTQWLADTPIRLSRSGGNLPLVITELGTPTQRQSVFYAVPDAQRRNAFKLAYTASDARAGNFIVFDLPVYQAGADSAPHVETLNNVSTVKITHNKSEADLSKLLISYDLGGEVPTRVVVTSGDAITLEFEIPVTGTVTIAYAPTSYPTHIETISQPALATTNAEYAQRTFEVRHNFGKEDISQFVVSYNTTSTLTDQLITARQIIAVDRNTLRLIFDEPPTGSITLTVRPAIRTIGGRMTAQALRRVASFETTINPYRNAMWVRTPRGVVRDAFEVTSYRNAPRTYVYDQYGVSHTAENLLVLRHDLLTKFDLLEEIENVRDRRTTLDGRMVNPLMIMGAQVILSGIEHAILFNDTAVDGTAIYDSFTGTTSSLFYIEFEGQPKQTFRSNIGGYVVVDGLLHRNVEGMAEDLRYMYDAYEGSEGSSLTQYARQSLGYDGQVDFLVDNNINKRSQFLFWKSMINHKGTHVPLSAFLKGTNVRDINVDEFWAYKLAEFGSVNEQTYPALNLNVEDSAKEEFRVEFLLPQETKVDDTFVGVRLSDTSRWKDQPDVVQRHPFETFFFNADVIHIDMTPRWIIASESSAYYVAPKSCDGLVMFHNLPDGTVETYTVGNDITKINASIYQVNISTTNTTFYNNVVVALVSVDVASQQVAQLIDDHSQTVVDRIPVWDPARNIHDQHGISAVDVSSTVDPASYNTDQLLDAQLVQRSSSNPWTQGHTGRTWLDTSKIGYLPYYDDVVFPNVQDRTRQWGRLEPWASIDLYEWTESPVPPMEYVSYTKATKSMSVGNPYKRTFARVNNHWREITHKHETHSAFMLLMGHIHKTGEIVGAITNVETLPASSTVVITASFIPQLSEIDNLKIGSIASLVYPSVVPANLEGDADALPILIDNYTISGDTWTFTTRDVTADQITSQTINIPVAVAMDAYSMIEFDDTDIIDIYVNGVYETSAIRPMVFDAIFGRPRDVGFLSSQITLVRAMPSVPSKDIRDVYPHCSFQRQDELSGEMTTVYCFWVKNKTINEHPTRTISPRQAATVIERPTHPYMILQDLRTEEEGYGIVWGNVFDQLEYGLPPRYRQMIVRGLDGKVTENGRYVLRFTRDFTLRDEYKSSLGVKHEEWKMFRVDQTYKIDAGLWNTVTEALIGHSIGATGILVPSLNRVLYDQLNGTATRIGLEPGQAFVDADVGLRTITHHLINEIGPFGGFGGVEFVARYDLTDSSSILKMMQDLYNGCTIEQLNYLFFELLYDALSLKDQYPGILKTSWVSLQIVRDLQTTNRAVLQFTPPTGCLEVPTTTTTTIPPTPIDDVDVTGCAQYIPPTTTTAPMAFDGDLTDVVCGTGLYENVALTNVITISGGSGTYADVEVVSGTAPPWMTFVISDNQILATGYIQGCNEPLTTEEDQPLTTEEGDPIETEGS